MLKNSYKYDQVYYVSRVLRSDVNKMFQNIMKGNVSAKLNLKRAMDIFPLNVEFLVLEKIRETLGEWVSKKKEKLIDATNDEIQNLASLVALFEEKLISKTAEADLVSFSRQFT